MNFADKFLFSVFKLIIKVSLYIITIFNILIIQISELKKGKFEISICNNLLETAKIFDFYKKCNNRKIRFFKEKMFSEILKIPSIENREEICELLFNNNDLTITNFGEYSDLISNYFVHVLIKFNNIKEKEYFKNLMTKIVSKFSNDNLVIAFNKFNENFFDNYESMQYFLELLIINFDNLKHYEKYINP